MDATPLPRSQRERMLAGLPYRANDPELQAAAQRARRLAQRYNLLEPDDPVAARAILHELLGSLGTGSQIRAPLQVDYGSQLHVGQQCFINVGLVALDVAPIRIGNDVRIGPNVQLLTPWHPLDPAERRAGLEGGLPIQIEDNVWLGGGVIVLPGVTIGAHTVVGAGAVVTHDLPAGVVAVGNPARIVRHVPLPPDAPNP